MGSVDNVDVRPVADAEALDEFMEVFETAWAFAKDSERRSRTASDIMREEAVGAYIQDKMVGTAMWFSMELTVPGLICVPMAGVSYVAVHPLFRRRGVLRALMRHQADELARRGFSLAGLGASEAEIYGRLESIQGWGVTCGFESGCAVSV
jgi:predicted acetyltransferase